MASAGADITCRSWVWFRFRISFRIRFRFRQVVDSVCRSQDCYAVLILKLILNLNQRLWVPSADPKTAMQC